MRKVLVLFGLLMIFIVPNLVNAITCTLNNPSSNQYDNGSIRLNVTSTWAGGTTGQNTTNVTITIGSLTFSNTTVNGSAVIGGTSGDFTYQTYINNFSEASRTAYATCYNDTNSLIANVAVNSTSITYTVDRTPPSVNLQAPLIGSTVMPLGNGNKFVTFEYIPTDTNLGNCSLHLNNQNVKSSSSGTTSPNVTNNVINRFMNGFSSDNSSVRVVIQCTDLAGLKGNSVNNTFNVLIGSVPYASRQQAIQQSLQQNGFTQNGFTVVQTTPSMPQTNLQKYLWVYLVIAIVAVVFIMKKMKK